MRQHIKNLWPKKPTNRIEHSAKRKKYYAMRSAKGNMPYLLNTDQEIKAMLAAIGVKSADELYAQLPKEIKLSKPLNLPKGLSEQDTRRAIRALAGKNKPVSQLNSFLGAGCYAHYIPAALKAIISRAEFLTAYTPYQAESSQGILQAIYEYQTYICLLTGMDVSNASLFDGASALSESVLMSFRLTQKNKVIVSEAIHPEYLKTLQTYLSGRSFKIEKIEFNKNGLVDIAKLKEAIDDDTACFALQSPNFFGNLEDIDGISSITKTEGIMSILVASPIALALLKEPAEQGIDIVCGDGQVLGGNLNFGGPSFGYLATKNDFLRQVPGRIVGKTVDKVGQAAYCLTLQAREQHIRREKATSNICSNQSLNAISSAVYLSLMGKDGLKSAALYSLNLAHYLYERLKEIKAAKFPLFSPFFNEFVWQIDNAAKVIKKLYKKNIIAGILLEDFYPQMKNCILSCCTETKTREQIDSFIEALKNG